MLALQCPFRFKSMFPSTLLLMLCSTLETSDRYKILRRKGMGQAEGRGKEEVQAECRDEAGRREGGSWDEG